MNVTRKINWLQAINPKHTNQIMEVQHKLSSFYNNNNSYYHYIDFSSQNWGNKNDIVFQDIILTARKSSNILEIGCGKSNILNYLNEIQSRYTGVDFSHSLMDQNKSKYPKANFISIKDPYKYPFEDNCFNLIFSTFVIEHVCFPQHFLDECFRLLTPGGFLIILCPDFVNKLGLTSQRVGFSAGTGREKLKKGKLFDAFITGVDNKIKIPLFILLCKFLSYISPKFFINIRPRCFEDPFQPDVDAVYLANKDEIITYFNKKLINIKTDYSFIPYLKKSSLIYLKFHKPQ